MKRYIVLVFMLAVCLCGTLIFSGCSEEIVDIGFITSQDTSDAMAPASNCMSAVTSYSEMNGYSSKNYFGECDEQIKNAVLDGADVLVLFGVDDEDEVYSCAGLYPDVKFVCVDFGNDFKVRANIICINALQTENGVFAGYAAVKEGSRIIGIQGEETSETANYIRGFVEGAQIAAVEIGVKKNPIQIYFNISGSDMLSERLKSWFENGCEVIFCSDAVYQDVTECITDTDIIITYGADRKSDNVAASVYIDYSTPVSSALDSTFENRFNGGTMVSVGVNDGASGFFYNSERFEIFSASDIPMLMDVVSDSDLSDLSTYKVPSDKGYSKIVLTEAGIISAEDEKE